MGAQCAASRVWAGLAAGWVGSVGCWLGRVGWLLAGVAGLCVVCGVWGNENGKVAARSRKRHMFSWQMLILKKGPQKKSVPDLDPSSFFGSIIDLKNPAWIFKVYHGSKK
jgi:hypothetical protein